MKFAVYTKTGCPYCDKIKMVLSGKGYNYAEYVLDRDFTREQFYSQFGHGTTFPRVILDDKVLGGCTESVQYLMSKGLI
jgi:glutaredoxin 3